MKLPDQCPSTVKTKPARPEARDLVRSSGRPQWRSVEEFAGSDEFRPFVEREFPAGASELLTDSRRTFLKLMGASLALAGAATIPGCRRPDHKIMPYSQVVPEEVIPGKPLYYATSMPLPGGGAEGLLVETHEARPTKIEGNPLHAYSNGKSSVYAQASILQLYDPDRLMQPVYRGRGENRAATWDDFRAWSRDHLRSFEADGGRGLAIVVDRKTSPSRDAARDALLAKFPNATWIAYDPVESTAGPQGSTIAFGAPHSEQLRLDQARVVVSLDRDFLDCAEPDGLANSRAFATTRRVSKAGDEMSRLYVFEPTYTTTGAAADHRWAVAPSRIPAVAVALAREILAKRQAPGSQALAQALSRVTVPQGADVPEHDIEEVARDLLATANRTRSLVVAGRGQPAEVHALCHAINAALENVGTTIEYRPLPDDLASSSHQALASLADEMRAGRVDTLVCIDVNPVYDAPAGLGFAELFAHVPHTVTLSVGASETAAASEWSLNGAHFLETWGDTEAHDGTRAPIQPMIAPLYGSEVMGELELLAFIAGDDEPSAHAMVRDNWARWTGRTPPSEGEDAAFEKAWRRALHDGVFPGGGAKAARPAVNYQNVATSLGFLEIAGAPSKNALDVVFAPANLHDGRYANCGWLQELPQAGSRVVWDNPATMSPRTAEALGLLPTSEERVDRLYTRQRYPVARMGVIRVDGHEMAIAAWVMPGMADNTVLLPLGYGRTVCGRVGGDQSLDYKVGFNTYALREGPRVARGATMSRINQTYTISSTQNNWSMESRTSIVRAIDKKYWDMHADAAPAHQHSLYSEHLDAEQAEYPEGLNLAERLGEMSHTPPNRGIYNNPYNESPAGPAPGSVYDKGQQWGMTIDLAACTGCGACTIACQAENNIPIVGKAEVARGREMTWIRVDRYYTGDDTNAPDEMLHQPVACVQCENAPCETVCPVNATVHGPEGLNYMVYNRCIGTRYCANNCPYKVRRFNFFDYGVKKFNGGYREGVPEDTPTPDNINWVPPRLRAKLDEIQKMGMNPNVTIRSRGVMEKCTYCIQRINRARIETKLRDMRAVPDGFFQVACQQACPSEAIVFGDIRDHESEVSAQREGNRSYLLLGYLNTRPRTSYLIRVRNPNPAIRVYDEHDPLEHGAHGGESHEGDTHGGEGEAHTSFFDGMKRNEDAGYAMSLKVIGVGGSA